MKKGIDLIIWIAAICVLFSAVYILYSRNTQKSVLTRQQGKTAENVSQQTEATDSMSSQQTETAGSTPQQTKEMAKDFELKDLNCKVYRLSDYKDKIVILVFWEVRCSYCKKEIPVLNELNKELKDQKDVAILAVCSAEKNETVQNYISANNITLNVPLDPDAAVYYDYGTKVIPNNYIINKDSSVYSHIAGPITKEQILKVIEEIREADTAK